MKPKTRNYPYDVERGVDWLYSNDPQLGRLIDQVGPYRLKLRNTGTLFQALLHSIVYQQLSGKAARSIHRKLLRLFPNRYPSPAQMLALSDEKLLAAGLSRAKLKAVKDLAAHCINRTIPHPRALRGMEDSAVVQHLRRVHGVGVWTAEMLLIFYLGRADILPAGDLGVLKGFRITYGLPSNPEPEQMLRHGERWRPYRSIASWYLWQASYL